MGKDLKGDELGKGLRQRKSGLYEARFMFDGENVRLTNSNLQALKKDLVKAKAELNFTGEYIKDITLNEWFNEWFYNYKINTIKKTSVNTVKQRFMKFGKPLGNCKLKDIKNQDIQTIITNLINEGRSIKYVKEIASTINSILAMAKENNYIKTNPAAMITVPPVVKKKKFRILEPEEEVVFLRYAKNKWSYELIYIMLNLGLRCGEIGGLRVEDIDFKKKTVRINKQLVCNYYEGVKTLEITTPKTANAIREIPFINDEMEEVFKHQIAKTLNKKEELKNRWRGDEQFGNLLFTSSLGSPMTRYNIERDINKIINEMNEDERLNAQINGGSPIVYQKCYPHALRHTFCSKCFKVGVNPKVVQMLAGHQNYNTTIDIYTHVMKDTMDDELYKFKVAELSKLNKLASK